MRTQKNLNLCTGMRSEHLALWCCPATIARRKIFLVLFKSWIFDLLALMAVAGEDPSLRLRFAATRQNSSSSSSKFIQIDQILHPQKQSFKRHSESSSSSKLIKFSTHKNKRSSAIQNHQNWSNSLPTNKDWSVIHKKLKHKRTKKWQKCMQVLAGKVVKMTQDVLRDTSTSW